MTNELDQADGIIRRTVLKASAVTAGALTLSVPAYADYQEEDDNDEGDCLGDVTFWARALTGDVQVPPVETDAVGYATLDTDTYRNEVRYEIHIGQICNPIRATLHLGEEGEDGPVLVRLYSENHQEIELIDGRFTGILAEGTFAWDDIEGPLEDASFDMEDGVPIYVNVSTEQYPDGEIRGHGIVVRA